MFFSSPKIPLQWWNLLTSKILCDTFIWLVYHVTLVRHKREVKIIVFSSKILYITFCQVFCCFFIWCICWSCYLRTSEMRELEQYAVNLGYWLEIVLVVCVCVFSKFYSGHCEHCCGLWFWTKLFHPACSPLVTLFFFFCPPEVSSFPLNSPASCPPISQTWLTQSYLTYYFHSFLFLSLPCPLLSVTCWIFFPACRINK